MTYRRKRNDRQEGAGQFQPAEKKQGLIWLWGGIVLMLLSGLPNLILGENAVFTYHDQLDGEMIAYILQAKNLFSGDMLPEFMGGMSKTALTLPAPIFVLLFLGENYCFALLAMQLIGRVTGFLGMYLLARETAGVAWMAAVTGLLYGFLPFLPVYGLSQHGIPLLFWCMLQIRKGKKIAFSYGYVAFFALASSLVLVGFGLLGMLGLSLIRELWLGRGKKGERAGTMRVFAAFLFMLVIYVAENYRLLAQMLGLSGRGEISHKSDYTLEAVPFWNELGQKLVQGGQHSETFCSWLVGAVLAAVLISLAVCLTSERGRAVWAGAVKNQASGRKLKYVGICLGWNSFFALSGALWNGSSGVALRRVLGVFGAFQMDRILWIAPCLWYLAAVCAAAFLWDLWNSQKTVFHKMMAGAVWIVLAVASGLTGIRILLASDIKANVQKLRSDDYAMLSYSDYYAVGVMEQVRDFLEEQTGKKQDAYHVVSLGIDPAAALYHGFYCLDGYSNHYALDYKYRFRRVIAPELDKSDYLRAYFDDWGNRCYLFSAECPGYYTIEKGGFYFQEYQLDIEALRDMGCSYLLSAAYIQNAAEQGLKLMNDIPFETEDSYYCIYVYEL